MNTYQNYIAGRGCRGGGRPHVHRLQSDDRRRVGNLRARRSRRSGPRREGGGGRVPDGPWGALSPTSRGRLLMKWGEQIAEHADRIAAIETGQNGKLFAEMRAQARIAQDWLYYFGGLADKIEGAVIPLDRQTIFNYTLREPLGVVGVITPWNSPTFIAVMSLAPALAAGNTIVLKPSEITSASSIELARLAEAAGHPAGRRQRRHRLSRDRRGARRSSAGGEGVVHRQRRRRAARSRRAPGSVWSAACSSSAARARTSCSATRTSIRPRLACWPASSRRPGRRASPARAPTSSSRFTTQFVDRLVRRATRITLGDPMLAATQMGPVATKMQLEKDESMVKRAVSEGAAVLCGGARPQLAEFPDGYFYQPTIVHQAAKDNFLMRNEVFGPVLAVTPFRDEAEVLALANDTEFGLAAGVWTRDINRAHKMARAARGGHRVDQHLPRADVQLAVRRLQVERHRPAERHRSGPPVSADQERLVRARRRNPGSVHHESVKLANG